MTLFSFLMSSEQLSVWAFFNKIKSDLIDFFQLSL